MNKTELIKEVSLETWMTKVDTERVINTLLEKMEDTLVKWEDISITGFGKFIVKTREARKGRNPRTQEVIDIPKTKNVSFSAGKQLKEAIK